MFGLLELFFMNYYTERDHLDMECLKKEFCKNRLFFRQETLVSLKARNSKYLRNAKNLLRCVYAMIKKKDGISMMLIHQIICKKIEISIKTIKQK